MKKIFFKFKCTYPFESRHTTTDERDRNAKEFKGFLLKEYANEWQTILEIGPAGAFSGLTYPHETEKFYNTHQWGIWATINRRMDMIGHNDTLKFLGKYDHGLGQPTDKQSMNEHVVFTAVMIALKEAERDSLAK